MRYRDRYAAGIELAQTLSHEDDAIVTGIPTGGCIVAAALATKLAVTAYALIATKIRARWLPELAIGAVGPDGNPWYDEETVNRLGVDAIELEEQAEAAARTVSDRLAIYREFVPDDHLLRNRRVIIADDGVATGYTVSAAIAYCQAAGASHVIVATPVIAPDTARRLSTRATVASPLRPDSFQAVGQFYERFEQLTDDDALAALRRVKPVN